MRRALALLLVPMALSAGAATDVISWEEAEKHVGQEVTVEGRVLGIHCSPLSCLLAFEPTFNRFTAVIQAERFGDFPSPDEIERRYNGRRVRVHGTIRENDKKPEIVLQKAEDLTLAGDPQRRVDERARAAEVQVETLERTTEVLERIEELTERLAATQERLDAVLAQMEQRAQELAAAAPPPAPPPPGYGEAQPRPQYEALRTVKRGMTRADVQRLVGDPLWIDEVNGGGATWYYGYGRSISFDQRGRAQALVGFPPP
jgi:hypothetical protein